MRLDEWCLSGFLCLVWHRELSASTTALRVSSQFACQRTESGRSMPCSIAIWCAFRFAVAVDLLVGSVPASQHNVCNSNVPWLSSSFSGRQNRQVVARAPSQMLQGAHEQALSCKWPQLGFHATNSTPDGASHCLHHTVRMKRFLQTDSTAPCMSTTYGMAAIASFPAQSLHLRRWPNTMLLKPSYASS